MRQVKWSSGYRAENGAGRKLQVLVMAVLGGALLLAGACKTTPPAGQSAAGGSQGTSATSSGSGSAGSQAAPGASGQAQPVAKTTAAQGQSTAGQQTLAVARSTVQSARTSSNPARVASAATQRRASTTPLRRVPQAILQAIEKAYDSVKKHTIDSEDFKGAALAVLIILGMSGGVVALALNARRRRRLTPSSSGI